LWHYLYKKKSFVLAFEKFSIYMIKWLLHKYWWILPVQIMNCNLDIVHYTFIACWWGNYENLFIQEYRIPWGQCPRGIWYSWVNKFSYFLNLHALNVLLYRMKPRKHIHVEYYWQTHLKSIGTLSQTFKNHCNGRLAASDTFRVPLTFSCKRTIALGGKWFLFHVISFLSCMITCSDFYPLSNQINLFMVINIWDI
jgi:hypothetical protein